MEAQTQPLIHLESPYLLTQEQRTFFERNGFIKLKQVLSADTLAYYGRVIADEVRRLNTQHLPLEERDTYGKAFLQIMNLWQQSALVHPFVFSRRLGQLAADLLQVQGVRLYHDQALFKEPGGGITPWHADQYYWPLANDRTITVWIPLQATPLEMGPLEFSAGSQHMPSGRDKEIGDESQAFLEATLQGLGYPHVIESFDLGEVSFHLGWLFHRAGANKTDRMRAVMTMIYMDKDMTLKRPENENQQKDWEQWCPGAVIGRRIDTPSNPIVFAY